MESSIHIAAIIPAAGRGERMRSSHPKVFTPLLGKPLLAWTLEPFLRAGIFSSILIACPPEHRECVRTIIGERAAGQSDVRLVAGGQVRQESVLNCFKEIPGDAELIAIHDGARPLVTLQLIRDVLERAKQNGAAIAAVPCKDTVKVCDEQGIVINTLERAGLRAVQTPQCFKRTILAAAFEKAHKDGYVATDEATLVERIGVPVYTVMGAHENIKVTTPEDIILCEQILERRKL